MLADAIRQGQGHSQGNLPVHWQCDAGGPGLVAPAEEELEDLRRWWAGRLFGNPFHAP